MCVGEDRGGTEFRRRIRGMEKIVPKIFKILPFICGKERLTFNIWGDKLAFIKAKALWSISIAPSLLYANPCREKVCFLYG